MALEAGFEDLELLDKIYEDVKYGAVIGCNGPFRNPSTAKNAQSALDEGEKVTDAIADWIVKGFCYGPIPLHQAPANAKFSGIMTRPKPTGAVRIILNLSSPAGRSVNEGIDINDFPTSMSSTSDWLRALNKAGRHAKMSKVDWSDAYKHLGVRLEDTNLQWFSWLGMAFKELCLIFGGASSAGIYDRVAKLVIFIVKSKCRLPGELVCQVLDDCCACAPAGTDWLEEFDATFFDVAAALGIKLAPRDDPEKSFGPSTSGTVLGIHYDSVSWTWSIKGEKLLRLLHALTDVRNAASVRQDSLWSINGKIQHIKPLIPTGRFNIDHLVRANGASKCGDYMVAVTDEMRRQLDFWLTMLRVCDGRVDIPDPDLPCPAWALEFCSDAAGGSTVAKGLGVGAVGLGWWAVLPWTRAINAGRPTGDGRRLDRLLSAWELLGPLLALCAVPDLCRGRPVRVWVDNIGSIFIWKKGYSSSCRYATTVVKAIASVAAGLGCQLFIEKITRCSTPMAYMADALSKSDYSRFWTTAYQQGGLGLPLDPKPLPRALVSWVDNPTVDDDLGLRLLHELARDGPVLGLSATPF